MEKSLPLLFYFILYSFSVYECKCECGNVSVVSFSSHCRVFCVPFGKIQRLSCLPLAPEHLICWPYDAG